MLTIQKGVPIPKKARIAPRTKYPFEDMEVGDMFFVPGKVRNTLSTHASTVGKALERKFRTQLCWMTESFEGWKVCEKDVKGAVLGIGVWRDK